MGAPQWLQARAVAVTAGPTVGIPSGFFEDGTYLRFRELSATYALRSRWWSALRVRSLSVTGAVRNLALWSRFTGSDPEVSNSLGNNFQTHSSSGSSSVDNNVRIQAAAVPLARYWVLRLNVGL
jgi:hypothetical protein